MGHRADELSRENHTAEGIEKKRWRAVLFAGDDMPLHAGVYVVYESESYL